MHSLILSHFGEPTRGCPNDNKPPLCQFHWKAISTHLTFKSNMQLKNDLWFWMFSTTMMSNIQLTTYSHLGLALSPPTIFLFLRKLFFKTVPATPGLLNTNIWNNTYPYSLSIKRIYKSIFSFKLSISNSFQIQTRGARSFKV